MLKHSVEDLKLWGLDEDMINRLTVPTVLTPQFPKKHREKGQFSFSFIRPEDKKNMDRVKDIVTREALEADRLRNMVQE